MRGYSVCANRGFVTKQSHHRATAPNVLAADRKISRYNRFIVIIPVFDQLRRPRGVILTLVMLKIKRFM